MHFFNPVPMMKLVEIIRGLATEEATYQAVEALTKRMGKAPVMAQDWPGFVVNRILCPMINEAIQALMEGVGDVAAIDAGMKLGAEATFSFDALKSRAQAMAAAPYNPPPRPRPDVLERIDYDAHGKIRYKTDLALWANGPSPWPVTFFHLGRFFQKPVRMHVVSRAAGRDQRAREIIYDESYFDMPKDSPAHELPEGAGFAGFFGAASCFGGFGQGFSPSQ
jgi:glucan biosynthesis protein